MDQVTFQPAAVSWRVYLAAAHPRLSSGIAAIPSATKIHRPRFCSRTQPGFGEHGRFYDNPIFPPDPMVVSTWWP
jgi:hypothetical protein